MADSVLKGLMKVVSANYTRPADTTAYNLNDALSNSISASTALTFSNIARVSGGSGYIVNASCSTSQITFAGALRLHLFKGSVAPTSTNDNLAYPLLAANNPNRTLGYIDFQTFVTGGAGSDAAISMGAFPQGRLINFDTNAANSNLYGLVQVITAFTPASAQTFEFYLGVDQG